MTKLFIINDLPNGSWSVCWPTIDDIRKTPMKKKVLDVLFGELRFDKVGFCLRLNNKEIDTLWLDSIVWSQQRGNNYSEYLLDMYIIIGVALSSMDDALRLQDWLEKQYIWQTLKT